MCSTKTTGIVMGVLGIAINGVAMYGGAREGGDDVRAQRCFSRLHPGAGARPALTPRSLPDGPLAGIPD